MARPCRRSRCPIATSPASISPARPPTFQHLWRAVGDNIAGYRSYPRIVGETGGKDFVIAHPSADVDVLRTALVRGAFEYQGQKCSAASRAYVPRSVWRRLEADFIAEVDALPMGDVSDFANFMGAVIDDRSFARLRAAIERARTTPGLSIVAGGQIDDSVGWFVRPTVVLGDDPTDEVFVREYFGPLLAVHVFDDDRYDEVVAQAADAAPYALTGAIIAQDRAASRPRPKRCGSRPATSTSTTSRPAPSWGSSRSAAAARAAPTTRPVRRRICCAGPARAHSRRRSCRPTNSRYPHMDPADGTSDEPARRLTGGV